AFFGGIVGLPNDGGDITPLGEMAIEAVGREVERAIGEPIDAEIHLVEAGFLDPAERQHPVNPLRLTPPETFGVLDRLAVHGGVAIGVDQRLSRPLVGYRIHGVGHASLSLCPRSLAAVASVQSPSHDSARSASN